jgi:hypothetical protein
MRRRAGAVFRSEVRVSLDAKSVTALRTELPGVSDTIFKALLCRLEIAATEYRLVSRGATPVQSAEALAAAAQAFTRCRRALDMIAALDGRAITRLAEAVISLGGRREMATRRGLGQIRTDLVKLGQASYRASRSLRTTGGRPPAVRRQTLANAIIAALVEAGIRPSTSLTGEAVVRNRDAVERRQRAIEVLVEASRAVRDELWRLPDDELAVRLRQYRERIEDLADDEVVEGQPRAGRPW